MLELTRECIEDAGVTDWHGRNIGCYIGNFGEDWLEISNKEPQRWGGYKTADFMISNRVSYEMGWRGPRYHPLINEYYLDNIMLNLVV